MMEDNEKCNWNVILNKFMFSFLEKYFCVLFILETDWQYKKNKIIILMYNCTLKIFILKMVQPQ